MMGMFLTVVTQLNDILFSGWNTNSWKDVLIASVIICTFTIIFEGIKTLKTSMIVIRKNSPLANGEEEDRHVRNTEVTSSQADLLSTHIMSQRTKQTRRRRIILFSLESLLHIFNFLCGYILMLLVMSYSVWFLLAVIVGSGLGYFISYPFGQHLTLRYSSSKTQNTSSCLGGVASHHLGSIIITAGINHS